MNKISKNVIGYIAYIAFLMGLIYGIPKGLSLLLGTPYPMASITSGSMWPELKKGDLVLIKGIKNEEEIKIDDIIVYRNPKGFTIHRVVSINKDTIITKGDANNTYDAPINFEEVVGKTLTFNKKLIKIPLLGNVSILAKKNKP